MRRSLQYPWYTFLFAIYSPLALLAYNTGQVAYGAATRSLLIILVLVFIFTILVIFLIRNVHKAGLIVTIALLLFFSYGHVYELVARASVGGILIGRHRYLLVLYLLLLAVSVFWSAIIRIRTLPIKQRLSVDHEIAWKSPKIGLRAPQGPHPYFRRSLGYWFTFREVLIIQNECVTNE